VKCYRHGGNEYNLRAKLEDLLEIEKRRAGKTLAKEDAPMTFSHASRLLHASIGVLRVLGWAWRWAEDWVDYNSSWEPLLEPDEREEDMTKEQLKIVDSTRESRCEDARKCRLAAFGAALRNRDYDDNGDFNRKAFERALQAILDTQSLVGPLQDLEKQFYIRWLSLAYWSKSRLLGFGKDKIEVSTESPFVLHVDDRSPKCVLGSRSLPGTKPLGEIVDKDDFLRHEVMTDEKVSFLPSFRKGFRANPSNASPRRDDDLEAEPAGTSKKKVESDKPGAIVSSKKKRTSDAPRRKKRKSEETTSQVRTSSESALRKAASRSPKRRDSKKTTKRKRRDAAIDADSDAQQDEKVARGVTGGYAAFEAEECAQTGVSDEETQTRTRRRKQEVTPVDRKTLGRSTRFDVVKQRRRQPTDRLAMDSFAGKSYGCDEHRDTASGETDNASKVGSQAQEDEGGDTSTKRSGRTEVRQSVAREEKSKQRSSSRAPKKKRKGPGRPPKKRNVDEGTTALVGEAPADDSSNKPRDEAAVEDSSRRSSGRISVATAVLEASVTGGVTAAVADIKTDPVGSALANEGESERDRPGEVTKTDGKQDSDGDGDDSHEEVTTDVAIRVSDEVDAPPGGESGDKQDSAPLSGIKEEP